MSKHPDIKFSVEDLEEFSIRAAKKTARVVTVAAFEAYIAVLRNNVEIRSTSQEVAAGVQVGLDRAAELAEAFIEKLRLDEPQE